MAPDADNRPCDSQLECKPLRFNRRRGIRRPARGEAIASVAMDNGATAVASVRLVDAGLWGIGIQSPAPMEVGRTIRLYFNNEVLPGRTGRIARCTADPGGGWRVGIATDPVLKAA